MKSFIRHTGLLAALTGIAAVAAMAFAGTAFAKSPNNGTTLAGYKTIDICVKTEATDTTPAVWTYSGEIAVWNQGAIDTVGFSIDDFIEYKTGNKWVFGFDVPVTFSSEIPAGTTQETALTFPYSIDRAPLPGTIRNNVSITITNHSAHMGEPYGPNPKVTYAGPMPPPACDQEELGCTYTQGYWRNKPGVVWPDAYIRDAPFFSSGKTWQGVMDTPVNESQGYYQLAHQYIAAVLNQANEASVPSGIQATLTLAYAWLDAYTASACTAPGSCGLQKDWAAVLDSFNNGLYEGGPPHCGDE